jgi:hypothetical protein
MPMSVDLPIFESQIYYCDNGSSASLHLINLSALSEIVTCGLGRTRFVYGFVGGVTPITVYFEDGGSLQRQSSSASWEFVKGGVRMPWHGEVYVSDKEAIISSGAVADLLKLDGSHIRYLNDKIVMLVTTCGDVFEIDYLDEKISEVKLNGKSYIQLIRGKWKLVDAKKPVYGLPSVSVHGFFFDAQEKHKYLDKYLTNGNLTTMRNGMCKFTFGAARV